LELGAANYSRILAVRVSRVLEPNPGEKRATTLYHVDSAWHFSTVSPAARRLDYTLNIRGGEVAGRARRFIVIGSGPHLCNSGMCGSCCYVVSAHVSYHLQFQFDTNWGSGSICKFYGCRWNVV
jgi:hypothetical protein